MVLSDPVFRSKLRDDLEAFISQKRASGYPYHTSSKVLGYLDTMIAEDYPDCSTLSKEICDDMLDLLCRYDRIIRDTYPDRTAFFPNQSGDYYSKSTLDEWFHEFWDQLPEAAVTKGNPPRVHDFRHTYCVYRLNQWVREHADLNALYPYLSEFMGHSNFADTDYYLTLAEPFYSEFESRMHSVNASILPEVPHED